MLKWFVFLHMKKKYGYDLRVSSRVACRSRKEAEELAKKINGEMTFVAVLAVQFYDHTQKTFYARPDMISRWYDQMTEPDVDDEFVTDNDNDGEYGLPSEFKSAAE